MKTVSQGPIDSMFASTAWEEMLKSKHLPEYKRKSNILLLTLASVLALISIILANLHLATVSNSVYT
jgi:hypothetical protein